jgi:hypothetical protein
MIAPIPMDSDRAEDVPRRTLDGAPLRVLELRFFPAAVQENK